MNRKLRILCCLCALMALACVCLPAAAEENRAGELVERLAVSYAAYGERDADQPVRQLRADPDAGPERQDHGAR